MAKEKSQKSNQEVVDTSATSDTILQEREAKIKELEIENEQLKKLLEDSHRTIVALEKNQESTQKKLDEKAELLDEILPSFEVNGQKIRPLKKIVRIDGVVYHFSDSAAYSESKAFGELSDTAKSAIVEKYPHLFTTKN